MNYSDLLKCLNYLQDWLLRQGYEEHHLKKSLIKFCFKYQSVVDKFHLMINNCFGSFICTDLSIMTPLHIALFITTGTFTGICTTMEAGSLVHQKNLILSPHFVWNACMYQSLPVSLPTCILTIFYYLIFDHGKIGQSVIIVQFAHYFLK